MKTAILKKQILIFLFVGLMSASIDFSLYQLLMVFGFKISISKGVGFVFGTIFSFFANRELTFQHRGRMGSLLVRFLIVYLLGLSLNVGANKLALLYCSTLFSFMFATALSATLNFLGLKFYVFQKR